MLKAKDEPAKITARDILKLGETCFYCGKSILNEDGTIQQFLTVNPQDGYVAHKVCRIKNKPEDQLTILITMGSYAIGDTITITPVLRFIKKTYPKCKLSLITVFPDLFKYNEDVDNVIPWHDTVDKNYMAQFDYALDPFRPMDVLRGRHMLTHSVDFVSRPVFGHSLLPDDMQYKVKYSYVEEESAFKKASKKFDLEKPFIVINPYDSGWESRSLGKDFWSEVIKSIRSEYKDYQLIALGGSRKEYDKEQLDNHIEFDGLIEFYDQLSLLESIAIMDKAACVVTADTGALHMAACTKDTKILGIFTVVKSRYRVPVRNGEVGYNFLAVEEDCHCSYAHKFFTGDLVISKCPREYPSYKCHPSPEKVIKTLGELMDGKAHYRPHM